jgi:hypothetical protein
VGGPLSRVMNSGAAGLIPDTLDRADT